MGDTSTKARLPMLAPPLAALLCDRDSVTHCELRRNAWAICLFFERANSRLTTPCPVWLNRTRRPATLWRFRPQNMGLNAKIS